MMERLHTLHIMHLCETFEDLSDISFLPLWLCAAVTPSQCGRCLQLAAELDICNQAARKSCIY